MDSEPIDTPCEIGVEKVYLRKNDYFCREIEINNMAKKEYSNDNPVTMASEPSVAYVSSVSTPLKTSLKDSMTVEAYFDKVRKALDKRYENL